MTNKISALADLGWSTFFSSQFDESDPDSLIPAKVMEVHRNGLRVMGAELDVVIPPFSRATGDDADVATIGDWLLLDPQTQVPRHLLDRRSLFKRRAAGTGRRLQLIAANVDTVFIVSSCNQDFSLPRLERYLVLASDAGVMPVVVLTKADLVEEAETFASQARKLQPGLLVETLNARDPDAVQCLEGWCTTGQTVALLGSSGVGKSTLVNTLTGARTIATQGIREDDGKGRHTTTARALHRFPQGGWLLDTPGMRALQLTDAGAGLEDVFADIRDIITQCRFSDCAHDTEPGCAIQAAIKEGSLAVDRFKRWRKLSAEEQYNAESLAQRRARDRAFGKLVKNAKLQKYGEDS
ncbi:MAG: ribosome small subunit-dependent GTPase A [Magnetospiraceae bacterium]